MKKFMIVSEIEDETTVQFTDTYATAKDILTNITCGMGGYAEIYTREIFTESGFPEYKFLEA